MLTRVVPEEIREVAVRYVDLIVGENLRHRLAHKIEVSLAHFFCRVIKNRISNIRPTLRVITPDTGPRSLLLNGRRLILL